MTPIAWKMPDETVQSAKDFGPRDSDGTPGPWVKTARRMMSIESRARVDALAS